MSILQINEMAKENPIAYCEKTIEVKNFLERQWIEFCSHLKEIRDKEMYKGRWDSFEDFLADPGMDMDKGTASRMITIHEKFILEYKVEPNKLAEVGGWSKVAELLPVITDKASAEEWLKNASVLSKSDLRKEVQEKRTGKGAECKHTNTYTITMQCCRHCGDKQVIKSNE